MAELTRWRIVEAIKRVIVEDAATVMEFDKEGNGPYIRVAIGPQSIMDPGIEQVAGDIAERAADAIIAEL